MGKSIYKVMFWLCVMLSWGAVTAGADGSPPLPYLGRLTTSTAVINILPDADEIQYFVKYRLDAPKGNDTWQRTETKRSDTDRPIQWVLDGLLPGRCYRYCLLSGKKSEDGFNVGSVQMFRTPPSKPGPISFALFSDSHITPGRRERMNILRTISMQVSRRKPDFVVMLGDNIQTFDSHGGPMATPDYGPLLYRLLRESLGELPAGRPCYYVNGNWEGENGWHPEPMRAWARQARRLFIPNPTVTTYPQGGSENEDYYAFAWGQLLCVTLNVTGYTQTDHTHGSILGKRDDWTLGKRQKAWLYQTLKASSETLKVIFIHHPVGGGCPDDLNARYGRGGGLAAMVGEQAEIHRWMREFGVQALFYGHDHVFTDTVVDGIHYVCVGSAGAPWKFTENETGYRRYWNPSGYTWVETDADGLAVSFVDVSGGELHRFFIRPEI